MLNPKQLSCSCSANNFQIVGLIVAKRTLKSRMLCSFGALKLHKINHAFVKYYLTEACCPLIGLMPMNILRSNNKSYLMCELGNYAMYVKERIKACMISNITTRNIASMILSFTNGKLSCCIVHVKR